MLSVDARSFWLGVLSTLLVGLILRLVETYVARRTSKSERKAVSDVELLDRCAEVMNGRIKYVIAYNRRSGDVRQIREAYYDVKRRFRYADPERILVGTDEWTDYMAAEVAARTDLQTPLEQRIKRVNSTGYAVHDAIAARRKRVTG